MVFSFMTQWGMSIAGYREDAADRKRAKARDTNPCFPVVASVECPLTISSRSVMKSQCDHASTLLPECAQQWVRAVAVTFDHFGEEGAQTVVDSLTEHIEREFRISKNFGGAEGVRQNGFHANI
jgi:hypothetical protein